MPAHVVRPTLSTMCSELLSGRPRAGDGAADEWLVRRARGEDVDAYEVLVRRHRRRIFRIALRMLGDRDEDRLKRPLAPRKPG
ncbi:hypothetical protein [Pseudonocardia charpentierae]|uniref:RNA polymerase sigma-70 region 2 domain-containing protein n=1 Tax=Pseudonocardia charpentierae TaxID=3075545 RepID=A0ABU2N8P3_9PSEU|nr:hypothetical protein [Pseudonocardia sp. DSM 45834]MDT0349014.1 hypothetical protein [Pseudonocardia sp. DSM 45834]